MSTYTPGPWWIKEYEEGDYDGGPTGYIPVGIASSEAVEMVFDLAVFVGTVDEQYANARLISAAPDLLEACKAARAYLVDGLGLAYDEDGNDTPEVLQLSRAIEKAEAK